LHALHEKINAVKDVIRRRAPEVLARVERDTEEQDAYLQLNFRGAFPPGDHHTLIKSAWQIELAAFIYAVISNAPALDAAASWVGLATGCGKSVVIALLVFLLRSRPVVINGVPCTNILFSSSTSLLTSHLVVSYINNQELFKGSFASVEHDQLWQRRVLQGTILVIDECDIVLGWNRLKLTSSVTSQSNTYTVVDTLDVLAKFSFTVAFTSEIPESAQLALEAAQAKKIIHVSLGNIKGAEEDIIDSVEYRQSTPTVKDVQQLVASQIGPDVTNVIVIAGCDQLIDEFPPEVAKIPVFKLTKMTSAHDMKDYQDARSQLTDQAWIIITNVQGGRGIDIVGKDTALVIVAAPVGRMAELKQFFGRGYRRFKKTAKVRGIVYTYGAHLTFVDYRKAILVENQFTIQNAHLHKQLLDRVKGLVFLMQPVHSLEQLAWAVANKYGHHNVPQLVADLTRNPDYDPFAAAILLVTRLLELQDSVFSRSGFRNDSRGFSEQHLVEGAAR